MVLAGILGREQQEDEVDRLLVDRIEVDRPLEPREDAVDAVEAADPRMRQRHLLADAGRAEPLALEEGAVDDLLVDADRSAGPPGKLAQRLRLAGDAQLRDHV